jgi:type 2A phosphatase activator TIP41
MTRQMSVPHTLTLTPNSQTFSIPPWTITAKTLPILSAEEITEAQATLSNLPLPEMPFGNNALILKHETSGWEYCFNGVEALKDVKNGELSDGDGGVKVGYAQQWLESR